jgi:hypothetical protein
MNSVLRICGVACLLLNLSACGTLYTLDVYAVNDPTKDLDKTYVLLSANAELAISSPEFQAYASQVEKALAPKGYERSDGKDLSTVALGIYISANISDPSKKYHSVQTVLRDSSANDESESGKLRSSMGSGQNKPMVIESLPEDDLSGASETGFATTVFTKHLNLIAFDLQKFLRDIETEGREAAVPVEIWSVDVETTGSPADLSKVVPVMVAAAEPYITERTDDVVRVKLNATDKRISAIRDN